MGRYMWLKRGPTKSIGVSLSIRVQYLLARERMCLACFWTANNSAEMLLFAIIAWDAGREGQGKLVRLTAISSLERGSIHTYMYI